MPWTTPEGFDRCHVIEGKDCTIWVSPRPGWCDRGRWLAQLDARFPLSREIDWADGWPRYYFDLDRAKAEIEAWLVNRGQTVDDEPAGSEPGPANESEQ